VWAGKGKRKGRGRSRVLTSPDADLERLLAEPPDVVAEVLLQQEGDLVLQHLRRRRRSSATADGAATAMGACSGSGLASGTCERFRLRVGEKKLLVEGRSPQPWSPLVFFFSSFGALFVFEVKEERSLEGEVLLDMTDLP
jgi:hypothetical protein